MTSPTSSRCLVVFARDPVPGQVKSRLIPAVGEDTATAIYRQMLHDTLTTASLVAADRRQLWIDTQTRGSRLVKLAQRHGMSMHAQRGADIGMRMQAAFSQTLRASPYVVLIGTDCPEYDAAYLDAAFDALEQHDAVIGPAADGGYVLIGLRSAEHTVFRGIPWGAPQVLAATRCRLAQLDWHWHELPTLHDVDEYEDLLRFPRLRSIVDMTASDRSHECQNAASGLNCGATARCHPTRHSDHGETDIELD